MEQSKSEVFNYIRDILKSQDFQIISEDQSRPWGGFYVLAEDQAQKFADVYFKGIAGAELKLAGKLSPKILIVSPNKRLSWQFHHRRSEIWQVFKGTVGVKTSYTDQEDEVKSLLPGDRIVLQKGERHRLIGLKEWGIVAEIWQHTDPANPSDETDIVRLQDDFDR